MTRLTVAKLAERVEALEREVADLRKLRDRNGLTSEEIQAAYEARRRDYLAEMHGWLWADLATEHGEPLPVSARQVMEVLAAHGRFPTLGTVEQHLAQLTGIGLAAYLGVVVEGKRTVRQWAIMPPATTTGRPALHPVPK